jgi:FMN phosphatase YigB (HAD superfamily)
MKIVSDFDGVVTDQTEEAQLVQAIFLDRLKALFGEQGATMLARAKEETARHPARHGWRSAGRITAYVNEDLFIANNAFAACLDDFGEGKDVLARIGVASFMDVAQQAYEEMVRRTHEGELKPMDPDAAATMQRWLAQGHEVVIVSNSGTDRIVELLARAGLDTKHQQLKVRGGARKFELGPDQRGFDYEGYWLDTNRPLYEQILREEKPDAVIGDVVSLDLALPLQLMRTEPEFAKLRLCLRLRPYTPAWAKALFGDHVAYNHPRELERWLE